MRAELAHIFQDVLGISKRIRLSSLEISSDFIW
jgi:hypothetical protein